MQPQDHIAEITALEIELQHLGKSLDQSIRNDEVLEKTRLIFHEMRLITERIEKLKNVDPAH
jgi:hypothetical protein